MKRLLVLVATAVLVIAACVSGKSPPSHPASPQVNAAAPPVASSGCQSSRPDALLNGTINVRPGEQLCIKIETRGNAVVPVALVQTQTEETLLVTLRQQSGPTNTLLSLHNPLGVYLKYQASIRVPGHLPQHTSTCPVLSHLFGIESWPYEIQEVTLTNFETSAPGNSLTCR
jgi:hypothetical protein